MLGELVLTALACAVNSDDNDTNREQSRREEMQTRMQTEAALGIEKERTKQQVIGGIFSFLNACVQDNGQNGNERRD